MINIISQQGKSKPQWDTTLQPTKMTKTVTTVSENMEKLESLYIY